MSDGTASTTGQGGARRRLRTLAIVGWALVLVVGLAVAWQALRTRPGADQPLPVLGKVPAFSLTDQDGQPFTNARMTGHVSVVNFIFTTCPTVCPVLTSRMAAMQKKLADQPEIRLVSFSVDPYTDTPAVLKEYGTKFGADFTRWSFVTGPYKELESAVVDGFKILMERRAADVGDFYDIVHGEHFVLVDADGRIRGYYRAETPEMQRMADDARRLAQESRK